MRRLRHDHLVNYVDSFLVNKDLELWVVMEYLDGGALTDVVVETVLNDGQIAAITKCCLEALAFLHSHVCISTDTSTGWPERTAHFHLLDLKFI